MESLRLLRQAAHNLLRSPLFSSGVVLCLALALGAGSSLFLFIYAILLRPLPVASPDRLAWISCEGDEGQGLGSLSYPDLLDLQQRDAAFSGVAGYAGTGFSLRRGDLPEAVRGQVVTPNYFAVLGVQPVLGRAFVAGDAASFAAREVVLSHDLWRIRFGADPAALGKPVLLNGQPFTVVGVAPKNFKGTQFLSGSNGLWVPLGALPGLVGEQWQVNRDMRWIEVIGRLRGGVSLDQAREATTRLGRQLAAAYPADKDDHLRLYPTALGHPTQRGARISVSVVLAVTAALVLLFACANVTSLLLARTRVRAQDLRIRVALGANRGHIVRQLLSEILLLYLTAGALALLLASWTGRLLTTLQPPGMGPLGLDLSIDGTVVAATLLAALLPGLAFGLVPALHASRVDVATSLRAGVDRTTGRLGRLLDWRHILLVCQVAISLVLLLAAGLLLRSLRLTEAVDLGIGNLDAVTAPLDLRPLGFDDQRAGPELVRIADRFRSLPRVRAAAVVVAPPMGPGGDMQGFAIDGHQPPPGRDTFPIDFTAVSPGYFDTLGIRLLRGRDFNRLDTARSPLVAIVNQAMADRFWPGRSAIGERMRNASGNVEVVGVVATSKYHQPQEAPMSFVYLPLAQHPSSAASLVLSADAPPGAAVNLARRALLAYNPNLPIAQVGTIAEAVRGIEMPARLSASLLSLCGLLTLLLAAIGIYAMVAYAVASRSREIGIRVALGARPGQLVRLILRQNLTALWVGSVLGLGLALSMHTLLRAFLFGVGATDPLTYVEVLAFFGAVGLVAALLPARRAATGSAAAAMRRLAG